MQFSFIHQFIFLPLCRLSRHRIIHPIADATKLSSNCIVIAHHGNWTRIWRRTKAGPTCRSSVSPLKKNDKKFLFHVKSEKFKWIIWLQLAARPIPKLDLDRQIDRFPINNGYPCRRRRICRTYGYPLYRRIFWSLFHATASVPPFDTFDQNGSVAPSFGSAAPSFGSAAPLLGSVAPSFGSAAFATDAQVLLDFDANNLQHL